jgi:hypothetical protein
MLKQASDLALRATYVFGYLILAQGLFDVCGDQADRFT